MPHSFSQKHTGFALLFTVLVVSVLLAISLSISNIALRELILSSATRNSHAAFYAADTALECALYADIKANALPMADGSIALASPFPACAVNDTTVANSATKKYFKNPDTSSYCFSFVVDKTPIGGVARTLIEARGYNTCDANNFRRVERGIRIGY
ncbi:MAG: pilus assembly PilX N-terminal domain-containing protein [Patescibacteria group bacterium]